MKDLQNQLNDFQADEHTGQKKKRKREVTDTNTSEEDMNKKVDELQVRLAEREAELEDTREILAQSEYTTKTTRKSVEEDFYDKISTLVESKMKTLEEKIENMQQNIDKKNEEMNKVTHHKQKESEIPTYSSALTKNIEKQIIGNVITAAKNTEKVQEAERIRRENNIVIHGATPNTAESDEQFVNTFLTTIGVSTKPSSIMRLGTPSGEKIRPLKLTMKTLECKNQIMSRLSNLKNSEERFRNLSIRDDHTFEERQLIKECGAKTKEMNAAVTNNECFYKLRGSPKNGLRIIRVPWNKPGQVQETNMEQ